MPMACVVAKIDRLKVFVSGSAEAKNSLARGHRRKYSPLRW
jgi:hypothetical protein